MPSRDIGGMFSFNNIRNVAVVGAGGNVGSNIVRALLATGKHTVTAITRMDSQTELPDGVKSNQFDYENHDSLVNALQGQDLLIITLSGYAPQGTELKLVKAAGDAGVKWILPNEWSPDTANQALVDDVFIFKPKVETRNAILEIGKSSFVAVVTGFWYEYTLAMPQSFGIDFHNRHATFFDDGETKISVSTLAQIGRAVAALLSLPIDAAGTDDGACLHNFKNKVVYVNSFTVSQKDILDSALRVTNTRMNDWTTSMEPSQDRYSSGVAEIKQGKRTGYAKMMYTRVFFPDGCGDFEHNKGTLNRILGLPEEDIDAATELAIERSKKMQDWVEKS